LYIFYQIPNCRMKRWRPHECRNSQKRHIGEFHLCLLSYCSILSNLTVQGSVGLNLRAVF
jgi:hypothetical protein